MRAFIGAATTGGQGTGARGITVTDVDGGAFTSVSEIATDADNPMYLALAADGQTLYAAHAVADGCVSAWRVEKNRLRPLGKPNLTGGTRPCHLSIHPTGHFLFTADYDSGSVSVHRVLADGSLGERTDVARFDGSGPDPERQEGPHAHMVVTDPGTGRGRGHVLVVDLGADRLRRLVLDETAGQLAPADEIPLPAGAGPRHLVVHGSIAYIANELDSSVSVVDLDAAAVVNTLAMHPDQPLGTSYPSAIRLGPGGRFLYVANRGVDEIAVFAVDGPRLTFVAAVPSGGSHPRDLVVDPAGRMLYAANQFSDVITSFRLDAGTGVPAPVGAALRTPSPSCLVLEQAGPPRT